MHEDILKFIKRFDGATECFMHGCCYWFAHILKQRFGGVIYYDAIAGHFFLVQGGMCYDIRGDVNEIYAGIIDPHDFDTGVMPWFVYQMLEPVAASRIEADSIYLIKREV